MTGPSKEEPSTLKRHSQLYETTIGKEYKEDACRDAFGDTTY